MSDPRTLKLPSVKVWMHDPRGHILLGTFDSLELAQEWIDRFPSETHYSKDDLPNVYVDEDG